MKDIMQIIIEYIENKNPVIIYIFWRVLHSNFLMKIKKPRIQKITFIILELNSKSFKS